LIEIKFYLVINRPLPIQVMGIIFLGGMFMKKWSTKMLVEAGIMIALALVLDRIKVYEAPQGGSVTAGSMVPIFVFAFRWGVGPGIVSGAVFGVLQLLLGGWFFTPIQAILEYPIAFGSLGLSGIFSNKLESGKKNIIGIVFGVLLGIGVRFLCHFIAGIVFFSEYAGDQNPWLYSLIYQAGYLVPEFIITIIVLYIIWKPISKINK